MKRLNIKPLLLSLSPLLALACGPNLFTGAEVTLEVGDELLQFTSDDEIKVDSTFNVASGRYRLSLSREGLSLRWPSGEPGTYSGELVDLSWEHDENYSTNSYRTMFCPNRDIERTSITVTSNEYGLISGYFSGYVCHFCVTDECEGRLWLEGNFAASIDDSWF
ncbi:hypothetical protein DL240_14460 [Lujinxingia litoralis]|uniref:Lipoprotein n=1 Tax=Lujinxingia litoralis TaxID=2211119 RepID=A0A328C8D0_9DELT|nr:hypothetical protein [Lujinxingia litoralis]RAL20883.1 hypothetical protein DL240_14460 [Lujinxingia litoralis]